VSGSWDGTAKVWRMEGAVSAWRCERTLAGHGGEVICVATWGGKMASGSGDKRIRVWDVGAGTLEQMLAGHEGAVVALATCGQRLISSSVDRTVKVWSMATWACVHTVQTYAAGSAQLIWSLAVSGPTLVGGSLRNPHSRTEEYEVRVWDLETLEPLHTLRQGAGSLVAGLASYGEEVWGSVGKDVVVWGRQG
jgi:WD40 repeat protein